MIVKITPGHVSQICASVRETFAEEHNKVNDALPDTFAGLAEYFFGLVMPIEDQQKVLALFPKNLKPDLVNNAALKIAGATSQNFNWTPTVTVKTSPMLRFGKAVMLDNLPGIKHLTVNGGTAHIVLAEDTTALPPAIRDFVTKVAEITDAHTTIEVKTQTEVENMRRFLKDHKTLQSAIAAMPALKCYLNWFIQQELDAPEPEKKPRAPRKRAEKQPYDIAGLVTKAAIARLNL